MGTIADIISLVPKSIQLWEKAIFQPRDFVRTSPKTSEAYGFLVVSLAFASALLIATSMVYFFLIFPNEFFASAAEALEDNTKAVFTFAGVWIVVGTVSATMGAAYIGVVARLLGAASMSNVFPRALMLFGLEWLCAIPTAMNIMTNHDDDQLWLPLLVAARLVEILAFIALFRVGLSMSWIRTSAAALVGVIPAVGLWAPIVHFLSYLMVGVSLIQGWD